MPRKNKGGRPFKVPGEKRTRVVLYLPEELVAELDRRVEALRDAGQPHASRGDVVAAILRRRRSR